MSIITPTNFNVQAQIHIDSRLTQADITARDLISTPTRYWGMQVHVLDSDGGNNPNTYILQKGTTSIDIFDNGNWVDLTALTVVGLNTEILFNDNGTHGTDVGFTYDPVKDMLIAGAGSLVPDFGTGAHAQAGSWSIIIGEEHDFKGTGAGGGRPVNMIINGWHHSIGDTTTGGVFSGAGAFATGTDHEIYGVNASAIGFGGAAHGNGSFVISSHDTDAGGLVLRPRVLAAGFGSINMSHNNGSQTVGHGALAPMSAIISGRNANIPIDSDRSVILGGDALKMPAATPDTVLVPNLMTDGIVTDTSGNTLFNKNFPYDEIWISLGGNDSNSGSRDEPLLTWAAAWTKRKLAPATRYSIIFDSGIWLDPTVMVFDDVGADSSETYIHGIQDGNIPRWSSGAAKIQMTNAGNIYFTGFGYYEDIEINQTGTRVCSAQFINVTVYGTVSSTGIAVPDNAQLMVSGSDGRITVENLTANDVIVPMRVQGSAYLNINDGDIDLASVKVYYSGQLYIANNHDVTIGDLDVFGDGQINVLGGSIIVNDTINWSGGTVNTWTTGTYDHSGATTTTRDERVLSEYHSFDPGATGLAATNVQDAITEVHGELGGTGNVSNTGTPVVDQVAVWTDATTLEGTSKFWYDNSANELFVGATPTTMRVKIGDAGNSGVYHYNNSDVLVGQHNITTAGEAVFWMSNTAFTKSWTLSTGNASYIAYFQGTSGIRIPGGTDGERPSSPALGDIRWNTTGTNYEGYNGATWDDFSSGGGVAGSGTLNQVAYWTAGDTLSSNAHLVYSGTPVMTLGTSTVDEDTKLSLTQTATSSTGDAQLFISTTATGGDPFIHLYMASTRGYIIGSDNNGGRNLEFLTTTSAVASPSSNSTLLGHFTDSGNLVVQGTISKAGGTSSQHLMADGSTTTGTFYAEPGIFSGGGTPTLASGVTGAEVRTLIGAGTSDLSYPAHSGNYLQYISATGTLSDSAASQGAGSAVSIQASSTNSIGWHVYNTNTGSLAGAEVNLKTAGTGGDAYVTMTCDTSRFWCVGVDNSDSNSFKIMTHTLGTIDPSVGTITFEIQTGGRVQIGTTNTTSGYILEISTKGRGTDWTATSDRDLKKDIKSYGQVLPKINQMDGFLSTYIRKDDPLEQTELGMIAQDVKEVFPELVSGDKSKGEDLDISYMRLGAIALQGIAELSEKNTNLENRIMDLEKLIEQLTK